MPSNPPPKGGMVSLYADLLDPSSTASSVSISRAPVVFQQPSGEDAQNDDASTKKQQISAVGASACAQAATLRFQPTKRPQLSNQKPKPKHPVIKGAIATSSAAATAAPVASVPTPARPVQTSSLADWTRNDDDDDVNGFYGAEKRQRGGRKKRKKNQRESAIPQNWDDIYDPSRPNNYEEYKNSDERIREIREWKDRLYAHRMARGGSEDEDSDDEPSSRPQMSRQFAPPAQYSFAPPPTFDDEGSPNTSSVPPASTTSIVEAPTGEDAYARRLRLSQMQNQAQLSMPTATETTADISNNELPAATISRAPVRYNFPSAPEELPSTEADLEETLLQEQSDGEDQASEEAPRSLRPGQEGFAERLMMKYGWTKGTGLGADGSGIINPLRVQLEKQKKKPDSEGGGFVGPGGRGKIIGGQKKKVDGNNEADEGKFGAMSEVIVLKRMVNGKDLQEEMEGGMHGEIMQEIGDECSDKYGRVERVYINRDVSESGEEELDVFVKFTSQLSALRAVNALEGRLFNGNNISARFFNTEKFEKGIYK